MVDGICYPRTLPLVPIISYHVLRIQVQEHLCISHFITVLDNENILVRLTNQLPLIRFVAWWEEIFT